MVIERIHENNASAPAVLGLWFSRISPASRAVEDSLQSLLSDSELKRLNSIGGKTRRREYLLSRALMRHALGRTYQRQDHEWRFVDFPDSAPIVSNLPDDAYISLSHSKGLVCFAIATCTLGVDLEATTKKRDFSALAQVFMNQEELACLRQYQSRQADYFYRVWSAKEACYKRLSSTPQSVQSLSQIRYSDLIDNGPHGYLYQASIEGFVVSVMMAEQPQKICRSYYLMDEQKLHDLCG